MGDFYHRYPFFALRGVDWGRQFNVYRPRVTTTTNNDELFDVLCQF